MQSALYYPFTGPKNQQFLKTALFLWDSVDFIVPYRDFKPYARSVEEAQALEIIGRNYVPSDKDKKNAHIELEKICNAKFSERFAFQLSAPSAGYDFYPQKLLPKTWEMLSESNLAEIIHNHHGIEHASTSPLFGYYMMTVLAIVCADTRKRMVTDSSDPYRALSNLLAEDAPPELNIEDWHGRLLALSLDGPDFTDIPLSKIIEARLAEGPLLRDLRRNFVNQVDLAAKDIADNADNINIVADRIKSFTSDMENDLKELKRLLRRSEMSLLLSKEAGYSVLTVATTFVSSNFSMAPELGLVTAGFLGKALMDHQDRKHQFLRNHPAAWLLSAGKAKF